MHPTPPKCNKKGAARSRAFPGQCHPLNPPNYEFFPYLSLDFELSVFDASCFPLCVPD